RERRLVLSKGPGDETRAQRIRRRERLSALSRSGNQSGVRATVFAILTRVWPGASSMGKRERRRLARRRRGCHPLSAQEATDRRSRWRCLGKTRRQQWRAVSVIVARRRHVVHGCCRYDPRQTAASSSFCFGR